MFQFAAALNLARRTNTKAVLDLSWFKLDHGASGLTAREFELQQFEVSNFTQVHLPQVFWKLMGLTRKHEKLSRIVGEGRWFFVERHPYSYDNAFDRLHEHVIIDGYFQATNYLAPVADLLRHYFIPSETTDYLFQKILAILRSQKSVAVHVRRGDYVAQQSASSYHGTPDVEYYFRAISMLSEKFDHIVPFVFSDDLDWCTKHFANLSGIKFVDTQHLNSAQTLFLMSRCDHQIISNSTFSWWAGWLNSRPDKVVVVPTMWARAMPIRQTELLYEGCIVL